MPFPSFPVEIWFQIMDRACQDDGATGLALSATSRELRALSELHRYQSVQINGWRQLLAFEKRLSRVPKAQREVLNLFVYLPSAFDAGYAGIPKWAPDEDSEEDASYVPSDSEDESDEDGGDEGDEEEEGGGEEEEEEEVQEAVELTHKGVLSPSNDLGGDDRLEGVTSDTDATPDIWDEEDELEHAPLLEEERLSLVRENTANLLGTRTSLVPELTVFCIKTCR
ncbi:hypothetical protein FA13DRAFT_1819144 [Coprinellus micaceus]|uniref:Uncharacterized protein n=1 Tax=Coprinellus micaceus TaxID=71717 RepID=A0A4Y7SLF9_COPMI|nr:hypothetical protein FA13DRAFT_1819144 [Coprinellus micaceus]